MINHTKALAGFVTIGGAMAFSTAGLATAHEPYRDRGWRMHSQGAVQRCVAAAERDAGRYGYGRAHVTEITSIRDKRAGFVVKGRIAVDFRRDGWRHRGRDSGKFTCRLRYGRIDDIRFSGIHGLR